jgi:hypothetical protein
MRQEARMTEEIIAKETFISRLTALCVRSAITDLPRRRSDRAILLKSIVLSLAPGRAYAEREIDDAIREWLAAVAPSLDTDHVSLRRNLVDAGHIERDPGGAVYRLPARLPGAVRFAPEIEGLDPQAVVQEARRAVAARKKERR